ncbi:pyrroloquinoline quinone biosynthesis protein PqqB [Pelagibacterium sp. 26DY04]|uniref:pyrroloquinoline quinone biosynthesis protein PqqB n=1 Tax=Pelagibacterium sp. 26DY04 TaxID=2967130 RepID=UPI002814B821|nr:pyrroloquinoline quinone biosynthesis protein PqqB [Pelagibacterium sp. 26DY04]WMT87760.1 pyrroloquinoline quinone biosynthesis protein PqqB [Pelagibacterium sp. 26DY04]
MIKIIILGAAAGGGVPQWNCGCANCRDAREGRPELKANQASAAISADGEHWFLVNASPDLRQQIANTPALHPRAGELRHSPIAGVILTNGEIDAITGLLTLREGSPFTLYAHSRVHSILAANSIFNALKPGIVTRETLTLGESFSPAAGLDILPFAAPGKTALFLEDEEESDPGDTIGLKITDLSTGRSVVFLPACAQLTDDVLDLTDGTDAVFFDGTLWRDDELLAQGLGKKTGQRMGHMSMQDVIPTLADMRIGQKFFFHINNSNPAWRTDSEERKKIEAAGWTIPAEGMEITL